MSGASGGAGGKTGLDRGARLSRRALLRAASIYGSGAWLALQLPPPRPAAGAAPVSPPAFPGEAGRRTLEALTARIVPSDPGPGALEADCAGFIVRALAGPDAGARSLYREGLRRLDATSRRRFGAPFAGLPAARQDALLADAQDGAIDGWPESPVFFETARVHTLIGLLADPRHGGNRGHAGWKLVRYPGPRHAGGGYTPEQMRGAAPIRAVWGEEL